MTVRIIHWTDPDYLEEYYEDWGTGQSLTSRQAKSVKRSEKKSPRPTKQDPQQEADSSQPSDGRQENHPLANTESGED
jgi:hypothetical protein